MSAPSNPSDSTPTDSTSSSVKDVSAKSSTTVLHGDPEKNIDVITVLPNKSAQGPASTKPADLEKGPASNESAGEKPPPVPVTKEWLDDLIEPHPYPEVLPSKFQKFRHGWFSTYRRLFALVIVANLATMVVMANRCARSLESFSYSDASTAVAANLFVGTLMRQEHVINTFFRLCTSLPLWLPLRVRRLAAKVYSYGGVHSACGISALCWYIFFTVLLVKNFSIRSNALLRLVAAFATLIMGILVVMIVASLPRIRAKFHDGWEMCHRFGGWSVVALVWAQLFLVTFEAAHSNEHSMVKLLLQTPTFWFLIAITCLIIYPWLRLQRLEVDVEVLSKKAARVWLHHKKIETCTGLKLSTHPLRDNHGFAMIPTAGGGIGGSILITRTGDWTGRLIDNEPTHLWQRGRPTVGVMLSARLFNSAIVVATGSGIGPCLSWLNVNPTSKDRPTRIIWSANAPEEQWGTRVQEEVRVADPEAVIIDTAKTGRKPSLVKAIYALYKETGSEAVLIISNPIVTKQVVFDLELRGVPAFGAIFDS